MQINIQLLTRRAALFGLLLCISACGFKLRGVDNVQLANKRIAILSVSPFGELEKSLQREIRLNEGVIADSSLNADWLLKLSEIDIQQQGVSRDATGRANEVLMHATLAYQIIPANLLNEESDDVAATVRTLKVTRSFYQDYRSPVNQQNQQRQTQSDIVAELSRLLMRQLERAVH